MECTFINKVFRFVEEKALFSAPCHIVIGVSGGADSMSLLHSLHQRSKEGIRLTAVHIHHGLRGDTADRDAMFVQDYCAQMGVPCTVRYVDAAAYASEHRMSVEEAGRYLRYDAFESVRQEVKADYIVTAHTADDQAETVLMHILRGCGTDGLSGIPPMRGTIRRPLLCCTRHEIEAYCAEHNVPYIMDETNEDTKFLRNRVRHELLPHLRELNPSIDTGLMRLAQHASGDVAFLRELAMGSLEKARQEDGWSTATFVAQPTPIRRRMIGLWLRDAGICDVEETHIVAIEQLMTAGNGKASLPGGRTATVQQGSLRLLSASAVCSKMQDTTIKVLPFSAGCGQYSFTLSLHTADENRNVHNLFLQSALDYDKVKGALLIRCRREGDYMHPSGRRIGKTIKKLMNEWKIPEHLRDTMPLLCDDDGVVLVPGYACDERVKPTVDTKHFLVWNTDEVKA